MPLLACAVKPYIDDINCYRFVAGSRRISFLLVLSVLSHSESRRADVIDYFKSDFFARTLTNFHVFGFGDWLHQNNYMISLCAYGYHMFWLCRRKKLTLFRSYWHCTWTWTANSTYNLNIISARSCWVDVEAYFYSLRFKHCDVNSAIGWKICFYEMKINIQFKKKMHYPIHCYDLRHYHRL